MKNILTSFFNQRGEGLLPVMIGAGLIGAAALAAGGIFKFGRAQNQFSVVTGSAFRLESQLISSLQNAETYKGAAAGSMRGGVSPVGLEVMGTDAAGGSVVIARSGSAVSFDVAGKPCSGTACALTSYFDLKCFAGMCRAAYRLAFNADVIKSSLPPLGARQWPPRPADYNQLIGFDLYRLNEEAAKCLPNELFVSGLNRESGAVECVRTTSRRLASNQIAKAVEFDAGTGALELKAINLRALSCPAKYVAQAVNPRTFETNPEGTCVYRYKKEVPWMTPWPSGASSVSGRFCPVEDYDAIGNGGCTVAITSTTNGYCQQSCTHGAGNSYECGYSVAPDTSHTIAQSVSGPNVTCSMTKTGTQQCGASWEGEVRWDGVCRITVPETLPGGGQ